MKKLLALVIIILIVSLVGCGKDAPDSTDSEPEQMVFTTAGHEAFQQNSLNENYRCISDGLYMVKLDEYSGSYIYFTEDASQDFIPLCGKPDCLHRSVDCNAYIDSFTFGVYNNRIYYAVGSAVGLDICCMNLDGNNHRKINELELGNCRFKCFFDHEFMYFYISFDNGELKLGRLKLENNAEPEYYNIEGLGAINNDLTPVEGIIYVDALSQEGERKLYRCSLNNTPQIVIDNYENRDYFAGVHFGKDKVRYYRVGTKKTNGFYEWDVSTGTEIFVREFVMPAPYGIAVYDDEYIYLEEVIPSYEEYNDYTGVPSIYIFDDEYNLISSSAIPFSKPRSQYTFIMATDDQILFSHSLWPERVEYYINKSEIAPEIIWHDNSSDTQPVSEGDAVQ